MPQSVDQLIHSLDTYGPRAAELLEAGWYFEEGGCFGMALAIADAIQATGGVAKLAVRPGPGVHAVAITNGRGLDWQGTVTNLTGYQVVAHQRFVVIARQHGHTATDLVADRAWAKDVIRLARELAADATQGLGTTEAFIWAYHATERSNLSSIQRHGLQPQELDPEQVDATGFARGTFFFLNFATTRSFAQRELIDGSVLRFPAPRKSAVGYKNDEYITATRVPPSAIEILINDYWQPLLPSAGLGATSFTNGLAAHRAAHAEIEAALRATDGSGDPDWLAYLFEQVRAEPCWELRQVRLAKLDTGETRNPDVIAEYAELDPKTRPPIVVARDGSVLDGGHRAQAAMARGERMIVAYVPC